MPLLAQISHSIGHLMFLASMAETSRDVKLLQITGMEISYLASLRWVHGPYRCRDFLMFHVVASFNHLPLELHGLDHQPRPAGDY